MVFARFQTGEFTGAVCENVGLVETHFMDLWCVDVCGFLSVSLFVSHCVVLAREEDLKIGY